MSTPFMTSLAQLHFNIVIWLQGTHEGTDRYGNKYYRERWPRQGRHERRWVVYNGEPEASKVPPEWFGWLHYTTNKPLPDKAAYQKPWQKPHLPNLTDTTQAYLPQGHLLKTAQRPHATGDYQPWKPPVENKTKK